MIHEMTATKGLRKNIANGINRLLPKEKQITEDKLGSMLLFSYEITEDGTSDIASERDGLLRRLRELSKLLVDIATKSRIDEMNRRAGI